MIFWNTKKLGDDLRMGRVSQVQSARYLVASVLLWTLLVELTYWIQTTRNALDGVWTVFSILAAIVGTWLCYRANARGDNRNLIERFICLSLPITMRVLVLQIALFIGVYFAESVGDNLGDQTTPLTLACEIAAILVFYRLMHNALLRTSGAVDEFGYATRLETN